MSYKLFMLTFSMLLLSGCSSVPENVRKAPDAAPTLLQVRQAPPEAFIGARVRWGGTISKVTNRQGETELEIVARELYGDGEPKNIDTSAGRFVAHVRGFLDPAIYAEGRKFTAVGTVSGSVERKLGEMTYRYPVIAVEHHYLWPPAIKHYEPYDPWFYDPWFYDPWYPRHHYPYYYY